MLLDEILQSSLLEDFSLVLPEVAHDLGSNTLDPTVRQLDALNDSEGTTSGGFPDVLFIIIVLGHSQDLIADQVAGYQH